MASYRAQDYATAIQVLRESRGSAHHRPHDLLLSRVAYSELGQYDGPTRTIGRYLSQVQSGPARAAANTISP